MVLIAVFSYFLFTGGFNISDISVRTDGNTEAVSEGDILSALSYLNNTNILLLNSSDVTSQLRSKFPIIKEVQVDKAIPSRVIIHLKYYDTTFPFVTNRQRILTFSEDGTFIGSTDSDLVIDFTTNTTDPYKNLNDLISEIELEIPKDRTDDISVANNITNTLINKGKNELKLLFTESEMNILLDGTEITESEASIDPRFLIIKNSESGKNCQIAIISRVKEIAKCSGNFFIWNILQEEALTEERVTALLNYLTKNQLSEKIIYFGSNKAVIF